MKKFKGKYRIETTRLKNYDYGTTGLYFITINTKYHVPYFGKIKSIGISNQNIGMLKDYLSPTLIGETAFKYWQEIPAHYPFVELDAFVIMPNHLHGILYFNKPDKYDWIPNKFGPQSKNLAAVIRAYKSTLKRFANQNKIEFFWQSNYHERIIRNPQALHNIRRYIK